MRTTRNILKPVENSGSWRRQALQRRAFARGRRLPPIPAAVYREVDEKNMIFHVIFVCLASKNVQGKHINLQPEMSLKNKRIR